MGCLTMEKCPSELDGKSRSLHRYTSIENVAQMLRTGRLFVRSPLRWEDTNDVYALELYRRKKKLKGLVACCFTQAPETYHHWKVYAPCGACVEFGTEKLLAAFEGQ